MSPREAHELSTHLEGCRECGALAAALSEASSRDNSGALPRLDELSRRRAIDAVLAGADQAERVLPGKPEVATSYRRRALAVGAALAAAAALALFLIGVHDDQAGVQRSSISSAPDVAVRELEGRVMLVSQDAEMAGVPSRPGDALSSGAVLSTGAGHLVAQLDDYIGLTVEPETSARLGIGADGSVEIALESGAIQISVRPGYEGPGIRVVAPQGTVEVTGTVFYVSARSQEMLVAVLRGRVRVGGGGGADQSLSAGQRLLLPQSEPEPLSLEDERGMWSRLRVLELLEARGDHAQVEVSSNPPGARVSIDGIEVGATPLTAAVRAGHRILALHAGGHATVSESLTVDPDSRITRFYNLERAEADVVERGSASDAQAVDAPDTSGVRPLSKTTDADPDTLAEDMLVRARSLRAAKDWAGAERAYLDLIRAFPHKAEVRASVVALGELQLGKLGKPSDALRQFDAYLDDNPNGVLAQEAKYGKIRALRALGRGAEEREALSSFIDRFPGAMQVPEAKRRLADLDAILELRASSR